LAKEKVVREPKAKKPFYKKWWVWVLAIIIIAGIANSGNDDSATPKDDPAPTKTAKADEKTTTTTTPTKKKAPVKKEQKTYIVGDVVKVGDMQYTVTEKTVADSVGPSILPTKASGKYVVVAVTLKNNGNKAVTVDSSFFKLKRGEKIYEADSVASMSANQSEDGSIDNSFFLQEVNPDSEISGKVVFDVAPEVASATDLMLQVQTGVFGTETENINLK
jgi:hypothetical protein